MSEKYPIYGKYDEELNYLGVFMEIDSNGLQGGDGGHGGYTNVMVDGIDEFAMNFDVIVEGKRFENVRSFGIESFGDWEFETTYEFFKNGFEYLHKIKKEGLQRGVN